MAVDDCCRLCGENLRVNKTLTNTKKIFEARSEKSVSERLAALGLTLSRDKRRSGRVCRSCFRLLGRIEAGFAVFRRWVEAEKHGPGPEPQPDPEPPQPPQPPQPPPPPPTTTTSTSTGGEKRSHCVSLKMEEDEDDGGSSAGIARGRPTTTSTSTAGHQQHGSGSEKRLREPSPAPVTPVSSHKKVCPEPPGLTPVPGRVLVPSATLNPTPTPPNPNPSPAPTSPNLTPTRKLSKETTRMPERRSLTKVIIYYPSHPKGEKITCQANTAGIVENITKQNWRRAANLIVRHKKLLAQLKENILKVIEEESQLLCNPYKGFMLWRSSAEDLKAFSFANLESDLRRMSPFTFSIFSRIAKQSPHATCAAAAIALRGREPRLSAFAYYVDCVLQYGGARKAVFIKLSKLGITTSHTCALGKQKELANACAGDFQLLKAVRKIFLNSEMDDGSGDADAAEFESAVMEVEKARRKKSATGATGATGTPPKPNSPPPPGPTSTTSTT